jgi:hypothetical protein
MILKMTLKCADVGHSAKPLSSHTKWTQRIIEEFYRQGDEERKLGLPLSPFMDRRKANVPKVGVTALCSFNHYLPAFATKHSPFILGFLNFLVVPMYEGVFIITCSPLLSNTHSLFHLFLTLPYQAQVGFLDFLVVPMYEAFLKYLEMPDDRVPCMIELTKNR